MYVCMYVCMCVCMYVYVCIERGLFYPYFKYYLLIFTYDIRLCILSVWHRNPTFLFHCHSQVRAEVNTHISKSNIQLL